MRLARLLASRASTTVTSIFRDVAHLDEVAATGATPVVLSLEDDPKEKFATVFEGKDIVYFSAGAGGKGGPERTKKVDYEGALKVFDAVELVKGPKPRLILVSAIDVRDRSAPVPSHYVSHITATIPSVSLTGGPLSQTENDVKNSEPIWSTIGFYMEAKYDADKNLTQRTAFKWTIIRPGWLSFEPGTGKATVGKAPLAGTISVSLLSDTLAYLAYPKIHLISATTLL